MKFERLVDHFRNNPFFEWESVRALASCSDSQLANQLSQWADQGKVIRCRKGKYLLSDRYRVLTPSVYYVANYLYRPSYVSLATALQFYGLIPEAVELIQSVTPRHGREWSTKLADFSYRSIKRERFWGYHRESIDALSTQNRFLIADPEKALLDLFYLRSGAWTRERLGEMRFQSLEHIDVDRLQSYTNRFASPKVSRAVDRFTGLYSGELTGER
ncbi:MAG: type IV toxin-antitoxin system AbiEi family antitoxin domain-containing protein [Planctomycetota bacterium]